MQQLQMTILFVQQLQMTNLLCNNCKQQPLYALLQFWNWHSCYALFHMVFLAAIAALLVAMSVCRSVCPQRVLGKCYAVFSVQMLLQIL